MWALSQSLQPCGWGISHAAGVPGWDTDVLSASRVLSGSAVVEASVLHRGNALHLTVAEGGGSGYGGYHLGKVDVRRELCDVMRLCYR